ncbi:hypothetical protein KOR42_27950 [Thalassoglobus neptunius]|uniref:Uncharacterized protein n=1 Tax=Thalassoglobus neptunius TaxID=1938619 RepID=A0A5C5WYR2_9PLAN|nr:hypothetical protein [Thalassoglobus neptunius]TWT55409.1 hypothetical protein KOR42_27950 [Thalassoglobus neptunius]
MNHNAKSASTWEVGDWVIYRKQKRSTSPGPRAEAIHPDEHGEKYTYLVEKYWVVEDIVDGEQLKLVTKRGKRHEVPVTDPRLREPKWWEKWILAKRFKEVEEVIV